MKKLKHNKLRNTGLLFEILSRNVMHEVLGNEDQIAIKIIKKHFKPESELIKELVLYQTLAGTTKNDPQELLKLTLESRNRLDRKKLEDEKYQLIRNIKSKYDLNLFFETRTSNYKTTASIFKLFENKVDAAPDDYLTSRKSILEHLSNERPQEVLEEEVERELKAQDPELRNLTFKYVVNKFNEKYRSLAPRQKTLLGKYINEDITHPSFRNFICDEIKWINESLENIIKRIDDEVMKIKLNETINLTESILSSKIIKDEHLSSMLKYYELIDELENN